MKFILSIILTIAFAYFLRKSIKKHAVYYYIGALVIALFTVFTNSSMLPTPVATVMSTFFEYGTVSTAMLSIVMWMNAFKNGSKIQKTFMPIRAELSIIACILTYGHNFYTGKSYFKLLFTAPEKMSPLVIYACIMTIILVSLMTPLFVTSFKCVRKKMKAKNWKKLQRLAYGFYMLIYVHIMFLMLPMALTGNITYLIDVIVYSIVFIGYGTLKLKKYYKKSKKPIAIVLIVAMYLALGTAVTLNLVDFSAEVEDDSYTLETDDVTDADTQAETEVDTGVDEDVEIEAEPTSPYDIDLTAIADGEYTGSGIGFNGELTVTVTIAEGAITKITIDEHIDDDEYMSNATNIRKKIIEAQDIDVDVITGATYSSNGIKDAVLDALS
ncbi:MAG: FMN-binding protein [Clostridia bacterium]